MPTLKAVSEAVLPSSPAIFRKPELGVISSLMNIGRITAHGKAVTAQFQNKIISPLMRDMNTSMLFMNYSGV